MLIAVLIAAATPSAEAQQLGRELAEQGTLAALLPLVQAKETDELVASAKDLSEAEKAALRATAERVYRTGRERLLSATGRAYAQRLTVDELKALVAFHRSPAAQRQKQVMPAVIAASMQAAGPLDFKKDVTAAFCKETGKLCDP